MPTPQYHKMANGENIAYILDGPQATTDNHDKTGLVWLGGFMSDMTGSKAQCLAELATETGRSCLRLDYSGHGASDGEFRAGTISKWLAETLAVFSAHGTGRRVIVGSSMGGWLALLLARHLNQLGGDMAQRLAGLVLIAPAADMTKDLMWDQFDEETRQTMLRDGFYSEDSDYGDEPYIITHDLIKDGEKHLLLDKPLTLECPVRILQGEDDPDVPWLHGKKIYDMIAASDVAFNLIKHGDHRLSTAQNLETLKQTCLSLCQMADTTKQPIKSIA